MKCFHHNCQRQTVVDCIKPELLTDYPDFLDLERPEQLRLLPKYIEYYCLEHCQAYGYCWQCGQHQGPAIRSLLNRSGLCFQCQIRLITENDF